LEHRASVKRFVSLQFINPMTVGGTPWKGDLPVARPLPTHKTTQTQNKSTQTSMPRVGFEPTIPVFEWAKTVRASDRSSSLNSSSGQYVSQAHKNYPLLWLYYLHTSWQSSKNAKPIARNVIILNYIILHKSRDSSVGIVTGYGLDGRCSILRRGKIFFSFVQTGSEAN
jgi:hypothetical protein